MERVPRSASHRVSPTEHVTWSVSHRACPTEHIPRSASHAVSPMEPGHSPSPSRTSDQRLPSRTGVPAVLGESPPNPGRGTAARRACGSEAAFLHVAPALPFFPRLREPRESRPLSPGRSEPLSSVYLPSVRWAPGDIPPLLPRHPRVCQPPRVPRTWLPATGGDQTAHRHHHCSVSLLLWGLFAPGVVARPAVALPSQWGEGVTRGLSASPAEVKGLRAIVPAAVLQPLPPGGPGGAGAPPDTQLSARWTQGSLRLSPPPWRQLGAPCT